MSLEPDPATDETEAYRVLLARVGRKSPKIPPEVLVRHILRCVPASEWPVRFEAMDALLRRLEAARRDELRISSRPEGGRVLGAYASRRSASAARPYRTLLIGVDPVEASCDCPDFVKNSLGLCKHALVVLEHVFPKPRLMLAAIKERHAIRLSTPMGPRWDPIRPLTGPGDWLDRVAWPEAAAAKGQRASRAKRWFRAEKNGVMALKQAFPHAPAKRLVVVEDILKVLPPEAQGVGADPALRALLLAERVRLKRVAKQALSPSEIGAALGGLKRTLYPYQRDGVARFLAEGRLLLADDMGLGKTAQAISCCDILWRTRRIRRGLIIAPASLKPQWAREWMRDFPTCRSSVVDGSPTERQGALRVAARPACSSSTTSN